ncbi:MAG: hypothetical protein HZA50_00955 [Planctomycetes bacterium]|nr:hypothetical protein [Planctomycetota bacterium]
MLSLPSAAEPFLMSFSVAFTQPTFQRALPLIVGAILTTGRQQNLGQADDPRGSEVGGHQATIPKHT